MSRICPKPVFREAYNGLSLFLTEYPHMDEEQREEVRELVGLIARPQYFNKELRRPGILCKSNPDGVLFISPTFVRNPESTS